MYELTVMKFVKDCDEDFKIIGSEAGIFKPLIALMNKAAEGATPGTEGDIKRAMARMVVRDAMDRESNGYNSKSLIAFKELDDEGKLRNVNTELRKYIKDTPTHR